MTFKFVDKKQDLEDIMASRNPIYYMSREQKEYDAWYPVCLSDYMEDYKELESSKGREYLANFIDENDLVLTNKQIENIILGGCDYIKHSLMDDILNQVWQDLHDPPNPRKRQRVVEKYHKDEIIYYLNSMTHDFYFSFPHDTRKEINYYSATKPKKWSGKIFVREIGPEHYSLDIITTTELDRPLPIKKDVQHLGTAKGLAKTIISTLDDWYFKLESKINEGINTNRTAYILSSKTKKWDFIPQGGMIKYTHYRNPSMQGKIYVNRLGNNDYKVTVAAMDKASSRIEYEIGKFFTSDNTVLANEILSSLTNYYNKFESKDEEPEHHYEINGIIGKEATYIGADKGTLLKGSKIKINSIYKKDIKYRDNKLLNRMGGYSGKDKAEVSVWKPEKNRFSANEFVVNVRDLIV